MATKKKSLNKAFVNVGKVKVVQADGTIKPEDKIIVMSEDLAKYIGATYTTTAPAPKKITIAAGPLKGRVIERQHSVKVHGTKYELGYFDGKPVKKGTKSVGAKIKWIPIHVPTGITLRVFLTIVTSKFSKKPAFIKTPAGISTRFVNA
jgi:hypothetical protein